MTYVFTTERFTLSIYVLQEDHYQWIAVSSFSCLHFYGVLTVALFTFDADDRAIHSSKARIVVRLQAWFTLQPTQIGKTK